MSLLEFFDHKSTKQWDKALYGSTDDTQTEFQCEFMTNKEIDTISSDRWSINNISRVIKTTDREINFQKGDIITIEGTKYMIDRVYTEEMKSSPIFKSNDRYKYLLLKH